MHATPFAWGFTIVTLRSCRAYRDGSDYSSCAISVWFACRGLRSKRLPKALNSNSIVRLDSNGVRTAAKRLFAPVRVRLLGDQAEVPTVRVHVRRIVRACLPSDVILPLPQLYAIDLLAIV